MVLIVDSDNGWLGVVLMIMERKRIEASIQSYAIGHKQSRLMANLEVLNIKVRIWLTIQ